MFGVAKFSDHVLSLSEPVWCTHIIQKSLSVGGRRSQAAVTGRSSVMFESLQVEPYRTQSFVSTPSGEIENCTYSSLRQRKPLTRQSWVHRFDPFQLDGVVACWTRWFSMALTIHGQRLGGGSLVVAHCWTRSTRDFVIW